MGRIAVLGAGVAVDAFALAGAIAVPAEDPVSIRAAWASLPADVAVVVVTPAAATALAAGSLVARDELLMVTMP